ncbi:MAG: hypothetical protein ACYTHK_10440 [Planctomycetota bacterium]
MRSVTAILLMLAACAPGRESLYDGVKLPADRTALVEVNTYAQKRTLRWVIKEVRLPDGPKTNRTFDIKPGPHQLEVEWRIYDASENEIVGSVLLPIADRAKKIDEGVKVFQFSPEAGKFYRLQWASRSDATIEGEPGDMELTLTDAGLRPLE